jgi:hypothetical protein
MRFHKRGLRLARLEDAGIVIVPDGETMPWKLA